MTERRIASARKELLRLAAEIDGLSRSIDPVRASLQARRDSLLRTIEMRRSERKEVDGKEMFEANARAIVAQSDPVALNEELDRLRQQVTAMSGARPVPLMAMSNGFVAPVMLLAMRSTAVRVPRAVGVKAAGFRLIRRIQL